MAKAKNLFEYALNRGWDAANYSQALGEEITNHYLNTDWQEAFELGVKRYKENLWQDGSPRETSVNDYAGCSMTRNTCEKSSEHSSLTCYPRYLDFAGDEGEYVKTAAEWAHGVYGERALDWSKLGVLET